MSATEVQTISVRRTVTRTGPADQLADLLRASYAAGRLATPPPAIFRHFDPASGTWTIRYQEIVHVPTAPASTSILRQTVRRLWSSPFFRRFAYVALALSLTAGAGRLTYVLFADEISAAIWLIVKAVAVVVTVVAAGIVLVGLLARGDCPGPGHCPPGFH